MVLIITRREPARVSDCLPLRFDFPLGLDQPLWRTASLPVRPGCQALERRDGGVKLGEFLAEFAQYFGEVHMRICE
jgi:hypothetical protein